MDKGLIARYRHHYSCALLKGIGVCLGKFGGAIEYQYGKVRLKAKKTSGLRHEIRPRPEPKQKIISKQKRLS